MAGTPKRENFIKTYTGKRVYPLDMRTDDIDAIDIAHSLSNQCRFSGHTREFYSVAEHSVRVADYIDEEDGSCEEQLWGLLHDASECYLVDLPRPIKRAKGGAFETLGRVFREAEDKIQDSICEHFGLPREAPEIVKVADMRLLVTEQRDLMGHGPMSGNKGDSFAGIKPLDDVIQPWEPKTAEFRFLARLRSLRK